MPCCGEKRAESTRKSQADQKVDSTPRTSATSRPARNFVPSYQYVGKTALTVIGPRTGRTYRFDRPGAVVIVAPEDSRALAAVTILQRVSG